jgi:hypothetical protein
MAGRDAFASYLCTVLLEAVGMCAHVSVVVVVVVVVAAVVLICCRRPPASVYL